MKVLYFDESNTNLTEEDYEEIEKIKDIYYSKKLDLYLMSDDTFSLLSDKYNLDESNITDRVGDWIENSYSGVSIDFMGNSYDYSDFHEVGLNTLEFQVDEDGDLNFINDDWACDLEAYMEVAIAQIISDDLEEELKKLDNKDFDMSIIKDAFNFKK